jgi:hypothetical protein
VPNTFSRLLSLRDLSLAGKLSRILYIILNTYLKKRNVEFKIIMSDTDHPVNRFVDLEARVDDTSDQEEDGDDSASFSTLIYGIVFLHIRITSQGFH